MSDLCTVLQQRIAELEAEVVELQRSLGRSYANAGAREERLHMRNKELQAEVSRLRQPCTHTPPGSEPGCAWCRMRTLLFDQIQEDCAHFGTFDVDTVLQFMERFDAAVQAVREGQK